MTHTLSNRLKEINNNQCKNNSLFFDCYSIVKTYIILQNEMEAIFEVAPEPVQEIQQEEEKPNNKIQKSTLDYIKKRKNKINLVEDDDIPGITNQHIVSMPPEIDEHIPKMTLADVKTDTFKATVLEDLINDYEPEPEPETEPHPESPVEPVEPESLPILEDDEPDLSILDSTPEINEDDLVFEQIDELDDEDDNNPENYLPHEINIQDMHNLLGHEE